MTTTRNPDDYVLSIGDLSHRVGLSPYTIRRRSDAGEIDFLRFPAGRRYTLATAEQLRAEVEAARDLAQIGTVAS